MDARNDSVDFVKNEGDGHGVASRGLGGRKASRRKAKTEEQLCRELFDLIDIDLGGEIDAEEMERFIRIVDPTSPLAVVKEILEIADEDKNGVVDFSEFFELALGGYFGETPSILLEKYKGGMVRIDRRGGWERYIAALPPVQDIPRAEARHIVNSRAVDYVRRTADPTTVFKQLFTAMDADGDGALSHSEMLRMVRIVMPDSKLSLAQAVIQSADKDGNGDIDFEEFQNAIEDGSFGMPAEELVPLVKRGLRKFRDEIKTIDEDVPKNHDISEDEVRMAMDEVRKMQYEAAEKRKTTKINSEEEKRIRLRGRLVNFYARHNPEKVREDDIKKVVDSAISRNIDEDDLFRSLYRKYNLDESGEPIQEESDWDASSEEMEIDESMLTEEQRQALEVRRRQKEEYRRIKREEELHKIVQKQIQKEAKEERQRAKDAREKFLKDWKTEDERKLEEEQRKVREAKEEADLKIKKSEDAFHRGLNRRTWLEALNEAKQQRFEERCIKLEKKRHCKRVKEAVYTERKMLENAAAKLAREKNLQIKWSQKVRLMEVLLDKQVELCKGWTPDTAPLEKEKTELLEDIDKAKSKATEGVMQRKQMHDMLISNKQYSAALKAITDSMVDELNERKQSIAKLRLDTLEHLKKTRDGTDMDVAELEEALDSSLEAYQAQLTQAEEERLQDMYACRVQERTFTEELLRHKEHCNSEINVLKARLLELYPSLLRDEVSLIGKRHVEGSPLKKVTVNNVGSTTTLKKIENEVVATLELWKPKVVLIETGAATATEFSGVLSIRDGSCFDMAGHVLLCSGVPPTPCEALSSPVFDSAREGTAAPLWATEMPFNVEGVQDDVLFAFHPGTLRKWCVQTERGATLEITVHSKEERHPRQPAPVPSPATPSTHTPRTPRRTRQNPTPPPNPPPSIA